MLCLIYGHEFGNDVTFKPVMDSSGYIIKASCTGSCYKCGTHFSRSEWLSEGAQAIIESIKFARVSLDTKPELAAQPAAPVDLSPVLEAIELLRQQNEATVQAVNGVQQSLLTIAQRIFPNG